LRRGVAAVVAVAASALSVQTGSATVAGIPRIAHVVVIVFENHERNQIVGSAAAPTFTRLAATYVQATSYTAVAHPSLPNYLALVSGSTHGVTDDCTDCPQSGRTIGSQLSATGRSWGAYAEGYPRSSRFAKKHVPFLYFPGGASHVLPLRRFDPAKLPAYALVVPDLCHDMHDCPVATGDRWLSSFIAPLLRSKDTAVFVVFDEGTSDRGGGGNVPLIVVGTTVRRHVTVATPISHYGLLRTIETVLGLPLLGHARAAAPLSSIWR
jgi:phosphatidylinositol-3-phosphatase